MKIEILIKMANDISDFFKSESDKELAVQGMKNHILRSWDPRMRNDILNYCHQDGSALSDLAKEAVSRLDSQKQS
jgi:formate dehydrogenase subunit delta